MSTALKQAWECTACKAHGDVPYQYNDDVWTVFQRISEAHASKSPECSEANSSRYVRVRP